MEEVRTAATRRGTLGAIAAALAVGALWVGLSLGTTLIFHFHPVLLGAAAGWGFRRAAGEQRRDAASALVVTVSGAVGVALGGLLISAGGRTLDPGWFLAATAAVGVLAGVGLVRAR